MFKRIVLCSLFVLSLALLGYATRKTWFRVPDGFTHAADGSTTAVVTEAKATHYYKAGCLLLVVTVGSLAAVGRATSRTVRSVVTTGLTATFLFPYAVTVWEPSISARAAWLHMQHENLTWLGGDIYMSGEYIDSSLKAKLYSVDAPRRLIIFDLPLTPPWDLDLNRLQDMLDWLGYTEPFCQFLGRGWVLAVLGLMGLLSVSCVADRECHRDRITHAARLSVAQLGSACLIAWTLPFVAGARINEAHAATRAGDYRAALAHLQRAVDLLPLVAEDTYVVAQKGLLDRLLGENESPEARLYGATLLDRAGRFAEANLVYRDVLRASPRGSACRREACRAVLRGALHAMNSGRAEDAIDDLRTVLEEEPCNLKANFALQLACLKTGRRAELEQLVDRMTATYAWFQSPAKRPVLSFARHNLFVAALDAGEPAEALRQHRLSLRP